MAGRKRKAGKRTPSGQLSRAISATYDRGNERAQQRVSLYGTNGGDCLGRAYVMGLLGEGDEAKDRLDIARKFASIYVRTYRRPYRCALNDNPRGNDNHEPSEFEITQEQWMKNNAALIDNATRVFFDQLVLPHEPLDDPYWLAGLLAGASRSRSKRDNGAYSYTPCQADMMALKLALRGIDCLRIHPPERVREDWACRKQSQVHLTTIAKAASARNEIVKDAPAAES